MVVLAHMMRMTRAAILNVMQSAYIETAELKGLSPMRVIWKHALPNAVAPIISVPESAPLALVTLSTTDLLEQGLQRFPKVQVVKDQDPGKPRPRPEGQGAAAENAFIDGVVDAVRASGTVAMTEPMAEALRRRGHWTSRSGIGPNVGCTQDVADALERRLEVVAERVGQRVAIVGATGSGKTTALYAALHHLIDRAGPSISIATVEDPVEFVHPHKNCIVTQRELGIDTDSWEAALKNTLRQAPDVILMGEIRDRETMEHAVAFAETGHLCMATLHANSANQALDRIINFFPEDRRQQLLMDLSLNLRSLISQRLLPRREGKGRVAAVEIMLNTPLISDLIFKGEISEIKELMKRSRELGMQTFDQALFDLYEAGKITYEDALRNADSVNDLRLQIKLNSQRGRTQDLSAGTENFAIV